MVTCEHVAHWPTRPKSPSGRVLTNTLNGTVLAALERGMTIDDMNYYHWEWYCPKKQQASHVHL